MAGPLIGLTVPALLLVGNKALGISSSLRHICAAGVPAGIPFLTYNWRAQAWNLWFVLGIALGGFLGCRVLGHPAKVHDLRTQLHLTDFSGLLPSELFALDNLANWKGWVFLVLGGFLVGFGTRYAGGCTSGHAISDKQCSPGVWIGGTLFGLGWALTGACPGPLLAQLGSGVPAAAVMILAALAGTWAYRALRERLP